MSINLLILFIACAATTIGMFACWAAIETGRSAIKPGSLWHASVVCMFTLGIMGTCLFGFNLFMELVK